MINQRHSTSEVPWLATQINHNNKQTLSVFSQSFWPPYVLLSFKYIIFKSYLKGSEHFTISRYLSLNTRTRIIFLKFNVTTLFSTSQSSFTSHNQRDQPRKSRVLSWLCITYSLPKSVVSLFHRYVFVYFLPHNGKGILCPSVCVCSVAQSCPSLL